MSHQTTAQLQPVLEQSLGKVDAAVQAVYKSQETVAHQLDLVEHALRDFDSTQHQNISQYIEKIIAIKEIVDSTQQRVEKLQKRAITCKERLREKQQALVVKDSAEPTQ